MAINFLEKLKEKVFKMSPEELAEARRILNDTGVTSRENPKGWLSIEEYLPKWLAKDFEQGYTIVKVKNSDGNTAELSVVLSMNQPAIREISRLFSNYQISEIMKKPPVTIGTEGKKPRTRKPKAK